LAQRKSRSVASRLHNAEMKRLIFTTTTMIWVHCNVTACTPVTPRAAAINNH